MGESTASSPRALAYFRDPNIRFPSRPVIVPDVIVFVMPSGLGVQIHGGPSPLLLRGAELQDAFKYTQPLLDGSHGWQDLLGRRPSDLSERSVARILMLLHMKGLLTDPPPSHPADLESQDATLHRQFLFWGRKIGATGSLRSGAEAQARLSDIRVLFIGTGMFGAMTLDGTIRQGVKNVVAFGWDDEGGWVERAAIHQPDGTQLKYHSVPTPDLDGLISELRQVMDSVDLAVVAVRVASAADLREFNQLAFEYEVPLLLANDNGTQYEIGPYIEPYRSACFTCLELRRASVYEHMAEDHLYNEYLASERPLAKRHLVGESVAGAMLAGGVLNLEVMRIATSIAMPTLLNAVLTLSPLDGTYTTNRIMRVPRCPTCGGGSPRPTLPHAGS